MSKWKNTGGPAFPRPYSEDTHNGTLPDGNDAILSQDGMSLRDWFAGQALVSAGTAGELNRPSLAEHCYKIADAMLAEREKER